MKHDQNQRQLSPSFSLQEHAKILWDIADEAPELLHALNPGWPEINSKLNQLRKQLPCANSINPFCDGDLQRPYRHLRAFYQSSPAGPAVLAYKGSEVHALDRDQHLAVLAGFRVDYPGRGKSLFSAAEHFALIEQKVPLALSSEEAIDDARAAAQLQQAHLQRFSGLAHTPCPLLVVQWPEQIRDSHLQALRPILSGRAMHVVENMTRQGLAAIVYHYPGLPLRVAHLPQELKKSPGNNWLEKLSALTANYDKSPEQVIDAWIALVARMLSLGFLPGRTEHIGIGHCLEMQNAVIDGGFVDVGSIIKMTEIHSEKAFMEMLMAAFADLSKTVRHFLLGAVPDVEAEYRNPSLVMLACLQRVIPQLLQNLATYTDLHPWLQAYLERGQASCYAALSVELQQLSSHLPDSAEHA